MSPAATGLLERVSEKRLVFCVTTGRSGTGYLSVLLSWLPGVRALHEPAPEFASVMREARGAPGRARDFWIEEKLPAILEVPEPIYVETSHLFGKGFLEPLLDLGVVPDLVLLRREPREVARSILSLGDVPGRSEIGRTYYLGPEDPGVAAPPDPDALDDYQVCYWYCLEMDRRADLAEARVREVGGRTVRVALPELSTLGGYRRLLAALDLPSPGVWGWLRWLRWRGRSVNQKRGHKRPLDELLPEDLDAAEEEVRRGLE